MPARRCPHCHELIGIQDGYYFDEFLNLKCGKCKKIVFPTSSDSAKEMGELSIKHNLPYYNDSEEP